MTLAYIVQPCKGDQPLLCVRDESGKFYTFSLSMQTLSRLNQECASIIGAEMGGVDWKRAGEEITALWSASHDGAGLVK